MVAARKVLVYTVLLYVYTEVMTKRLVDIDDELLERARAELGCDTIKDTVNRALAALSQSRTERIDTTLEVLSGMPAFDRDDAWR